MFAEDKADKVADHQLEGMNSTNWKTDRKENGDYARVDFLKASDDGAPVKGYFTANVAVAVVSGSSNTNDMSITFYADGQNRHDVANAYQAVSGLSSVDDVPWKNHKTSINNIVFDNSYLALNSDVQPDMNY